MENTEGPNTPGVIAPPPYIFLGALAIALGLHLIYPVPILLLPEVRYVVAGVLIVLGLSLSIAVTRHFHRADTPVSPLHASRHIVVSGPYRFSRNPDYVGQTLVYCGSALLFNSAWLFVALVPALLLVRNGVIAREEHYLERLFGEEYRRYRQHVRRWI